jgi:transcription elongation GreA/GreB family factor
MADGESRKRARRLLEKTVTSGVVLDPEKAGEGVAAIGSLVLIQDLASGDRSRHRLGSAHSGDRAVISAASPIGHALMGATAGTVVTVDLPRGRSRSVRVLAGKRQATTDEAA